jgi:hypothetical protein
MNLPVVLYGCGTWSLTLREEHRLRAFENRVLSRMSGPKRDEVTGSWRKLHNEELQNFNNSPSRMIKSRRIGWERRVVRMGENWKLMGKSDGKRPLGRPRCTWRGYIQMDFREAGWGGMEGPATISLVRTNGT